MKKNIIIIIILSFLIVVAFIPKIINVVYQNSTQTKVLNVKLFLDDKELENDEVVFSPLFPNKSSTLNVNLGYHIIKIKCDKLKLEKSVKVFTLIQNNVEFEFIGNEEDGFEVIVRDSWFSLDYE